MIKEGAQAPDFALPGTTGAKVRLSDVLKTHSAVVLAFYLLDFSGGWSSELSQFEAKYDEFQAMGAEIVGISVDSHFSHAAFAQKLGLRYPLLSDFDREVCGDYVGYFDEVAGYRGVNRRAIVVLAPSGMVSRTWVASKPADVPDTEMVREAVQDVVQGDDG